MLEMLRLSGLGVIAEASLDLGSGGPGLIAITGETGAGKTMVLTGLGLLLGNRSDSGIVRGGTGRAEVEARVMPRDPDLAARLAELVDESGGALDDDGSVVLARVVAAEGRSRCFLGGRSVPATTLAELGRDLVAVHGQSDQMRLRRPAVQRSALDRFAGSAVVAPMSAYRTAFDELRAVEAELAEITAHREQRAREADMLRHGLSEIDAVAPEPGEDTELARESERLSHAEALREASYLAHAALRADADSAEDLDALTLLARAIDRVEAVSNHDPRLAALVVRLRETEALLGDTAHDLASYAASVDSDPARLDAVEARRGALGALRRRYGSTIDEVLAWADDARERLAAIGDDDGRREELEMRRGQLRSTLARAAADLSRQREAAAATLGQRVSTELGSLSMPHARLAVEVRQRELPPDDPAAVEVGDRWVAYGPTGVDEVEFLLTPHPSSSPRPLDKGASGGELSRIMLALEVVLAGTGTVPTLVFDEVDAGVGGRAAIEVGRRLARLGRTAQVIVVTHLPQVAAFADRHVVVTRDEGHTVTAASVTVVSEDDRVRELARMLAGLEASGAAAEAARELLGLAEQERATA